MAKFLSDEEIIDIVHDDIKWAQDFRDTSYRDDWQRFYSLYKNFIDRASYPFDANLAIPTAYTTIEVQVSFLTDFIFEAGDFIEVLGKTPQGQASAHSVKQMLEYHFRHSFRLFEEFEKFIRQLLMFGSSIFKTYWNYKPGWKTRYVPDYNPDGSFKDYKEVLSPEVLLNQPAGHTVDIFNFGVDPNASHLGEARFAFEETWLDPMELLERQQMKLFKNVEKVLSGSSSTNRGLVDRFGEISTEAFQKSPVATRDKVHVIDYWGHIAKGWKGQKLEKSAKSQLYHVVLAMEGSQANGEGRPVVLLAEPSPFAHNKLPFIDSRINSCVGEFYGTGDIEYCESLFLEQRDQRNIMMDNLVLTMNGMYKVRKGASIDPSEMRRRPGGLVHVDEMDDIEPLVSPPLDPGAFRAQEDIRRDIEQVTGVNDFIMGQYRSSTGFNDTATGISLIQQVAMKRIAHKGQIIQRAIRDLGQMTFALIAQYEPFGTSVRVLDRDSAIKYRFIDVSPEALQNEYDYHIVNSPSVGSKPMRQNQLIQLLQIMLTASQQGGPQFDMHAYVKRLLDEMGIPNPDEMLGFPDLNSPLPPELGELGETENMLPPDEENRLMVEGQMVYPKMRDNHPHHMIVHQELYDSLAQEDYNIKERLSQHYSLHAKMAEATKELMATTISTEMQAEETARQAEQFEILAGGRSPTGANGQEAMIRALGNAGAGNVG